MDVETSGDFWSAGDGAESDEGLAVNSGSPSGQEAGSCARRLLGRRQLTRSDFHLAGGRYLLRHWVGQTLDVDAIDNLFYELRISGAIGPLLVATGWLRPVFDGDGAVTHFEVGGGDKS